MSTEGNHKHTFTSRVYMLWWWQGNELSGSGIGTSVSALQYAVDAKVLRNITDTLYASAAQKPLVIAPDGFFDYGWYSTFLKATGPGVIDFITRHIYNLGPGLKAPPLFIYLWFEVLPGMTVYAASLCLLQKQ